MNANKAILTAIDDLIEITRTVQQEDDAGESGQPWYTQDMHKLDFCKDNLIALIESQIEEVAEGYEGQLDDLQETIKELERK